MFYRKGKSEALKSESQWKHGTREAWTWESSTQWSEMDQLHTDRQQWAGIWHFQSEELNKAIIQITWDAACLSGFRLSPEYGWKYPHERTLFPRHTEIRPAHPLKSQFLWDKTAFRLPSTWFSVLNKLMFDSLLVSLLTLFWTWGCSVYWFPSGRKWI